MNVPRIYLIAGEPSGDRLGAGLIAALRQLAPETEIAGIGGQEMRGQGLEPLFGIEDLAVMGIAEVVPRLPVILRRLREATRDVLDRRPTALVTIDAPSFGLRVAERVRRADRRIRTVHYVAPTVWAWRPGRARHMARFVDQVLALLPFEPPYMEAAGMACDFVGHPVAERAQPAAAEVSAFRSGLGVAPETPLVLLAPGSRSGEVTRHMAPMAAALAELKAAAPNLAMVVPVAETVADRVMPWARALGAHIVGPQEGEAAKQRAFAAADFGIGASGTVTLELAAAGTPHVLIYRTSWLTAAIVRRLVRVDTAHMVNLVLGKRVVPERLQEACTAAEIAEAARPLLVPGAARDAQSAAFDQALAALGRGGPSASEQAARAVLRGIGHPAGG
ncbi:MAG: lipid-A-disaccharide synthase [Pikeienuella sp.]